MNSNKKERVDNWAIATHCINLVGEIELWLNTTIRDERQSWSVKSISGRLFVEEDGKTYSNWIEMQNEYPIMRLAMDKKALMLSRPLYRMNYYGYE